MSLIIYGLSRDGGAPFVAERIDGELTRLAWCRDLVIAKQIAEALSLQRQENSYEPPSDVKREDEL